ncbi:MAG: aminoacyl-tRNA hydrolase [Salibacteraceae bacterium]|jgi:peptidyl-tRNA hydrolase, PTH1 family|nr:aminoacyl-tRNA hydrolase [Salibacteraceae bacterium]MDP4844938.1 aminoacyl-tRNA hydrolase [Salibacteraceae bacterium]
MKFLIVGLGNPGSEYSETRHNIGFKVLDALAGASNIIFSPGRLGDIAEIKYKGRILVLVKPSTFMNLSGKAVNYWMQEEKIPVERTMIITDDLALPFGKMRIKGKGSDGGHNGLKSINATLNTQEYPRLRFGIGNNFGQGQQVDYVLGKWNEEELKTLEERIKIAAEATFSFTTAGLPRTMNMFNNR